MDGRLARVGTEHAARSAQRTKARAGVGPESKAVFREHADEVTIPVDGDLLAMAKPGDTVELVDTRHRERILHVVEVGIERLSEV